MPRQASEDSQNDTVRWMKRQEKVHQKGSMFMLVVGLAVLGFAGTYAGREAYIRMGIARSGIYTGGLAIAKKSQSVIKSLGEPVDNSMFDVSGDFEPDEQKTYADIFIQLHGPKGEGRLEIVGVQAAGNHPPFFKKIYFVGANGISADLLKQ